MIKFIFLVGFESVVTEGDSICFGVNLTNDAKSKGIGKIPKDLRVVLKKIQDELKFDQSIEFNLRLKASAKVILTPGAEPVIK